MLREVLPITKVVNPLSRLKKRYTLPLLLIFLMAVIHIIARLSTRFADFYVTKIFPVITNVFSFISGLLPFSLGEIMIIAALILLAVGIPLTVILLIIKKDSRKKITGIFFTSTLWIIAFITVTENMNCFIMYQCTPFSQRYLSSREHPRSELIALYSALIDKTNELATEVPRDKDNRFYITADVNAEAKKAMKKAAKKYPQLKGYYPDPKPIMFSYFMSQSNLSGIYFPFSLESNYNDDMVKTNLPGTICHEYSHLKGVIQEDEANFISFIATTGSDNIEFQYCGYLEALEYVHNQIYDTGITEAYYLADSISDEVRRDWFRFMPDNYWEENKKKEIISTKTVSTVSESAIDTNIKMNGREEGIDTYSYMVDLLLDYYFPDE